MMAISRRSLLLGGGCGLAGMALGAGLGSSRGWQIASDVPRAMPVETLTELPASADVVVIGAGIAGLSTALFLNERGMDVVVLEKGVVSGEQSGRAFGWIYSNGWDLGKLELASRSVALWSGLSERFGADIGFRRSGNFWLAGSEEETEAQRGWLKEAIALDPQLDSRVVVGAELDALMPGAGERYASALYKASDGTAEPTWSVSMIAKGAIRVGVRIVGHCAARSIEREGGRTAGVHTELGYIKASHVVLAGGAWSSLFARNLGVDIPQLTVIGSHARLGPVAGALPGAGFGPDCAWRQHADGQTSVGSFANIAPVVKDSFRYFFEFLPALKHTSGGLVKVRPGTDFLSSLRLPSSWGADEVSPFEQVRMLSARPYLPGTDLAVEGIREAFPQYRDAVVREEWGGVIDATPDSTQIVDEVPGIPGLLVITGFSGNGLTTGLGSGEMIAQMITGEKTTCDPAIYRFDRFTDGSELVFRH